MPLPFRPCLLAMALLAGCEAKVTSTIDADVQQRVETLRDCLPHLYPCVEQLLDVAQTWRGQAIENPTGLVWTPQPDGRIDVEYTVGATTIFMAVRFYSPSGAQQTVDLSAATSLQEAVDLAATALNTLFPGNDAPFVVGDWSLLGPDLSGSGALTGLIGGATNGNELEELRTTAASSTISGGPPAAGVGTVFDSGVDACSLSFALADLRTDESPTQHYPIGTMLLTLTGQQATVAGTVTFDGSAIARITVDGINATFTFNVETRELVQLS